MTVAAKIERAFLRICDPSVRKDAPDGKSKDEADMAKQQTGSSATTGASESDLCAECSRVDFRAMLEEEKAEQGMGPLSDHLHEDCPFCQLISQAIALHWGDGWTSRKVVEESKTTPNVFIQSRSPIAARRHGYIEYPDPRLLLALDITPPGFNENRRVIREIDRVKDRHIIAEIEIVPGDYDKDDHKDAQLIARREVLRDIDYEMIKGWLHACKSHEHTKRAHEQMKQSAADTGLFSSRQGFRTIDVQQECLTLKTHPHAFAALSYVWGKLPTILHGVPGSNEVPILLTTKENLEHLSTPGALSAESIAKMENCRLPQTVLDAMEVARKIGMRHLWIDTLCIVQDDKEDKSFLIQAMDDIYDISTVTFIAAAGENANSGLRGVSKRSGRPINSVTITEDGITEHLSLSPPALGEEVRHSVWNTRGWTFQEQALSQRCLYFTDDEVFFNCIELQWREAYALEKRQQGPDLRIRTGPPWWNRKLRKDPDPTPYHYLGDLTGTLTIKDYQTAVQDYSRKTLSFPEDVLHAFEGVFNRFSKCHKTSDLSLHQTQGIPVNHLHQALLWFPSDETVGRKCANAADAYFASWSWAAWDGPIEFVFADSLWLSRNITQAPMKKVPMHYLIPCWHYGETDRKFYSQEIWEAACEKPNDMKSDVAKACISSKTYAKERIGLSMDALIEHGKHDTPPELNLGELGFMGAYLDDRDVVLSGSGQVKKMGIGDHKGEFRFDDEVGECDEYIAVVTSDTITKPPDTQSIILGLCTKNGVSQRMGLGWVYYSKEADAVLPEWKFKYFRIA